MYKAIIIGHQMLLNDPMILSYIRKEFIKVIDDPEDKVIEFYYNDSLDSDLAKIKKVDDMIFKTEEMMLNIDAMIDEVLLDD